MDFFSELKSGLDSEKVKPFNTKLERKFIPSGREAPKHMYIM